MAILSSEPMFDPKLLLKEDGERTSKSSSYTVRPLQQSDYHKGFLTCLADLTWIGGYSEEDFNERYQWLATRGKDWYYCIVADDGTKIVASATLVLERKFIHGRAMCGHVEEVVVLKSQQGTGLGYIIMKSLQALAENLGARKMILNCSDHNIPFYAKCGFEKAGQQMKLVFGEGNWN